MTSVFSLVFLDRGIPNVSAPPSIGIRRHKATAFTLWHAYRTNKASSNLRFAGTVRGYQKIMGFSGGVLIPAGLNLTTIFRNRLAKGGQRDAKNFWSSLSKQTREKSKNLKCNNGVRHYKHEDGFSLRSLKTPRC